MIASRNMPSAINAPITAPMTATMPPVTTPTNDIGATPMNVRMPANHKNRTNTINPIMIRIAPTALLLPDPKYAVKNPAMMLAMAKTSISMLKNDSNNISMFFSPS